MIDVHIPTTDGRELQLTRYTQPEPELMLLLERLKLDLPDPAAAQNHRRPGRSRTPRVVPTRQPSLQPFQCDGNLNSGESAKFG